MVVSVHVVLSLSMVLRLQVLSPPGNDCSILGNSMTTPVVGAVVLGLLLTSLRLGENDEFPGFHSIATT